MTKKISKLSFRAAVAVALLSGMTPLVPNYVAMAATPTTAMTSSTSLNSINFGVVTGFAFSTPVAANVSQSVPITVTAEDINGNIVSNYAGTVHLTSSDEGAVLPKAYTFQPSDKGTHTFWVTFNTAGTQTVSFTSIASTSPGTSSYGGINTIGTVSVRIQPVSVMLAHRIQMTVNGSVWIDPMSFALDNTMRVPIYHVQYVLGRLGFQTTWDGLHLTITTPKWLPTQSSTSVIGQGPGSISLNGTLTTRFTNQVETKWDGPPPTTYAEFNNVFQTLALLGIGSRWTQGDNAWNWQVPLSIQGQSTLIAGQTDPLSLNWTTGTTVAAIPSSLVSWTVSGGGDATIDASGNFHTTVPGTYTVTGTYAGIPTQMKITVQPRVTNLQVSAFTSTIAANGIATDAITATATDGNGKPVVGADLTMALNPSNLASLDTYTGISNSQGQAVFTLIAGTTSGKVTVSAAGGGATASTNVNLLLPRPASVPSMVKFMNPPGVPSLGSYPQDPHGPIAFPVEFQVLDQFGNPMPGVTLDFTQNNLQGTMDVSSTTTGSQGAATVNYTWTWFDYGYIVATIHGTNISAQSDLITNGGG